MSDRIPAIANHRRACLSRASLVAPLCAALLALTACDLTPSSHNNNDNSALGVPGTWSAAFDTSSAGALSSVWGSGPDDVFIVGGRPNQGEVYHFDGSDWSAMRIPEVPFLVWVFGFDSNDVYAVGLGGGAIHFDGSRWRRLTTGVTDSLWGVWGASRNDLWIVGGDVKLVVLHYDGAAFKQVRAPTNDRAAESLYKIWGIDGRIFSVGGNGLIIENKGGTWTQLDAGVEAYEDFISLWGTDSRHIFAVGGRTAGQISLYNGSTWKTLQPLNAPGLNAVFTDDPAMALCGGAGGFVGRIVFATGEIIPEDSGESGDVHAVWGDGEGRYYAVGGQFSGNYSGMARVRTLGPSGFEPAAPLPPPPLSCEHDDDCGFDETCVAGECSSDADCTSDADCPVDDPCAPPACHAGQCDPVPLNCDDGNPCTTDRCDNGGCQHEPKNCDDGNPCTLDECVNGVCINTPLCDSDEICVNGVCEPAPQCVHDEDCDDFNDCTDDACVDNVCEFASRTCADGDDCTVDACVAGLCINTAIPDCACTDEADCPAGADCNAGRCTPVAGPDIEIGQHGGNIDCTRGPYERLRSGDELDVCQGFQGLGDAWLTLRVTGFPSDADLYVTTQIRIANTSCSDTIACNPAGYVCIDGKCSPTGVFTLPLPPTTVEGAVRVARDVDILVSDTAQAVDGLSGLLFVEVINANDFSQRAHEEIPVVLFGRILCFTPDGCPPGQSCQNGICDHE